MTSDEQDMRPKRSWFLVSHICLHRFFQHEHSVIFLNFWICKVAVNHVTYNGFAITKIFFWNGDNFWKAFAEATIWCLRLYPALCGVSTNAVSSNASFTLGEFLRYIRTIPLTRILHDAIFPRTKIRVMQESIIDGPHVILNKLVHSCTLFF